MSAEIVHIAPPRAPRKQDRAGNGSWAAMADALAENLGAGFLTDRITEETLIGLWLRGFKVVPIEEDKA